MRYGVILAGGGGTRLWPASRRQRPKQLLALGSPSGESLLAATARRLRDSSAAQVAVVTAAHQAEAVRAELPSLAAGDVIAEPQGRNTAAAVGLAAVHLEARDPDAVVGVVPSDQHIADEAEFSRVVDRAFAAAEESGAIVTVGIVPTRAETGFGYLEVADEEGPVVPVVRFVEKPDLVTAESYVASGRYLWNGGMFFARASRLLADIDRYMPDVHAGLRAIGAALGRPDADEVAARIYATLPSVSIDYGVMEKTSGVLTVRGDFGWNDVGSWSALADYRDADDRGNVIDGAAVALDSDDNIVVTDQDGLVAVVGVSDLVVVKYGDAVLVIPRDRAQDVRRVVAALEERGLDRFL